MFKLTSVILLRESVYFEGSSRLPKKISRPQNKTRTAGSSPISRRHSPVRGDACHYQLNPFNWTGGSVHIPWLILMLMAGLERFQIVWQSEDWAMDVKIR
jgi:hypothetical protein